jgi:hypothetical protein
MTAEIVPIEGPPHLFDFIQEEIVERGWDRDVLASLLLVRRYEKEWGIIRLELDLWFDVGPTTKKVLLTDKFANELSEVFGCSPEFFKNLHRAWMERGREKPKDSAAKDAHESNERGEANPNRSPHEH